ncbi:MAG: hypothetical protein C4521_11475 [Actinobacteria bacterium]|nr:MAG: hypothetical protein C4521_11475 [Actinomycetota bacterium]
MKRILVVLLAVCVLISTQAVAFADLVAKSADDPTFDGGEVTVDPNDNWSSDPEFMTGAGWESVASSIEESLLMKAKEESSAAFLEEDLAANPELYESLAALEDSATVTEPATGSLISADSKTTAVSGYWAFACFKIPNYSQGQTPYCGPFSALQILRYRRYWEPNLLKNLISEMYIPGKGSSIYRLAYSLRKRLRYPYVVSKVPSVYNYMVKHILTVGQDKMPIDNLVRIYPRQLGRYKAYHAGHYIDSSGYALSLYSRHLLYITDTYQEYVYGKASGTLGPQWVSLSQMYWGVRRHPLQSVVF